MSLGLEVSDEEYAILDSAFGSADLEVYGRVIDAMSSMVRE